MLVDTGISGDPGAGSLLTFAQPNPDLQYFEVGDVVRSRSGVVTTLSESDYNRVFGGPEPDSSYNAQTGGFTVDFINTGFTGNTTMYANISLVSGTFNVYAKDLATVLYTNSIPNVESGTTDLGVNFEDIGRIEWLGDYSMSWFKAGGVYVNPSLGIVDAASITAIDTTANTMTVSGGAWSGDVRKCIWDLESKSGLE